MPMKKIPHAALLMALSLLLLSGCGCANNLSERTSDASEAVIGGSYSESSLSSDEAASYETASSAEDTADGAYEAADSSLSDEDSSVQQSEKLIYTADLSLETKEYDSDKQAIEDLIEENQGIIQSKSESDSNYDWYSEDSSGSHRYLFLTVLIPADQYETFLDEVSAVGHLSSSSQNVENITKQYSDNEEVIAALEKEEERLQEMMDKAETIEDMISVEERITSVETQLNQAKNAKSSMDQSVDYSTVYLSLNEVTEYRQSESSLSFREKIKQAFQGSLHFFGQVFELLLYLLIYLIPFAILAGIILLIVFGSIRHAKKKKARKKAEKENQTDQQLNSEEKKEKSEK